MTNTSKTLRLNSIPLEGDSIHIECKVLYFPKEVYKAIRIEAKSTQKINKPLKQLADFIRVVHPDVLHINYINERTVNEPWIYIEGEVSQELLADLIETWFSIVYPRITLPSFNLHIESFAEDVPLIEGDQPAHLNDKYHVVQNHFINQLEGKRLVIEDWENDGGHIYESFYLKKVHTKQGPKLIQDGYFDYRGEKWSYEINLSLETIPYERTYFLHIHPKVKRWAKNIYTRTQGQTVHPYVQFPEGILTLKESPLIQTDFRWDKGWDRLLVELLRKYGLDEQLPAKEELNNDPYSFLSVDEGCSVFVPYGNHLKKTTNVKPGMSMKERLQISEQIRDELQSHWSGFGYFPEFPKALKQIRKDIVTKEVDVHGEWQLEVYYKDELTKDLVVNMLEEQPTTKVDFMYRSPSAIKYVQINDQWGEGAFHLPDREALVDMNRTIGQTLTGEAIPTLALFEIQPKEEFQNKIDPKDHLRKIYAENGRLTQFINPKEPKKTTSFYESKVKSGLRDLMRQLGVSKLELGDPFSDLCLVGIRIFKSKGLKIPVLTAVTKDAMLINVPSFKSGWLDYREGLLQMVGFNLNNRIHQVKEEHIYREIEKIPDIKNMQVNIMMEKQNCSDVMKSFHNNKVHSGHNAHSETPDNWTFIQLRAGDQTPSWSVKEDPTATISGIFQFNGHTYISIVSKPATMKESNGMKVTRHSSRVGKNTMFRQESAVEVFVPKVSDQQSIQEVVRHTHLLRESNIQTDDHTLLPLPLHLGKLSGEYFVSINEVEESGGFV
ncbi:DUF3962 domain-containing protein [Pontibacillus sp. ALD_SL1]|uniref:pPIWI_RE module domain-containing protein n=1 Tax=Pontibacillus sp. ALD_SL1 TaxID=2777185 RepID=UPI001A9586F1|nr:DUF3962 domain-containing protein [Pontibacillus sp. ALD_SL1]QSS99771.1 DUF3962 domain-containing protein [Pontibacillus sp. ALD_SL1]